MDLLTEAIKQVPALAVVVFLVVWFLRYVQVITQAHRETLVRFEKQFEVERQAHEKVIIDCVQRSNELFERCLVSLDRVERRLGQPEESA